MRCPRCGFVAFRDIEKCPSCGERLRGVSPGGDDRDARATRAGQKIGIAGTRSAPSNLGDHGSDDKGPLATYSTVEDVAAPLADYSLRAPESFVPASRRPARTAREAPQRRVPDAAARRSSGTGDKKLSLSLDRSKSRARVSVGDQLASEPTIGRQLRSRFLAGLIDLVLLSGINAGVIYFTTRLVGFPLEAVAQLPWAPLVAFLVVFNIGYAVTLTAIGGQTIGKMAVGLRVEEADGSRITPVHAVIRTAAYAVSVLPLGLGFVGMFLRSRRALHDLLADTRVVLLS